MLYLTRDTKTVQFRTPYGLFGGEGEPQLINGEYQSSDSAQYMGDISPGLLSHLGVFLNPGECVELYLGTEDIVRLAFGLEPEAVAA